MKVDRVRDGGEAAYLWPWGCASGDPLHAPRNSAPENSQFRLLEFIFRLDNPTLWRTVHLRPEYLAKSSRYEVGDKDEGLLEAELDRQVVICRRTDQRTAYWS